MPRRKWIRRFEPRYGVSQAAVEIEAKYLIREIEDCEVLAMSSIDAKRITHEANCKHSWEHFQRFVESLPEQEQKILDSLLFREFYHILELYLASIRIRHPESTAPATPIRGKPSPDRTPFNEWLFDPT